MLYEIDLTNEKEMFNDLISEGEHHFRIADAESRKSKTGKEMIVISLLEIETKQMIDDFLMLEKGQRWKLKNLLKSIGLNLEDGVPVKFTEADLVGKRIKGIIVHLEEKFINRDGQETTAKKSRIKRYSNAFLEGAPF